ncbi:hypothetical protein SAMN05421594_2777 [Chryseobacterium oleae]|uniref:Uncharacterized protein n=1 Tax=Chryseobacterium oleae TaxID=491207 RepID=A0A1I4YYJ4_CHROL|nr:hypothetical protein SAMN05421594_2777 [Chryseobacterium oleae]
MMNTEWLNLRLFNGDVKTVLKNWFVILQDIRNFKSKKIIRVAAPDGGVES